MDIVLWVAQVLLALAFFMAGIMKMTQPYDQLKQQMGWVLDFSPAIVKTIGVLELLAAIGLILPSITRILPWLTPLAAVGLVLTMIGTVLTHLRRNEMPMVIPNVVLLALALFVVYGRFTLIPLA